MATTFNVEDDLIHVPDPDPRWRESYYFSCFDPKANLGLWHSIGKRPARGHAGFALGLWGRHTLAAFEIDTMERHDDRHEVRGLRYECLEPMRRWRLTFDGPMVDCATSEVRLDPALMGSAAAHPDRQVPVRFDLEFEPVPPPCVYAADPRWSPLFTGHIDQVGRYRGWVEVASRRFEVHCWGGNDHSWGIRDWLAPRSWRWVDVQFGETGPNIVMWQANLADGEIFDGAVYRDGEMHRITRFTEEVKTSPRELKAVPVSFRATFEDSGGGVTELNATVEKAFPVIFRSKDGRTVSWNDRAVVRCESRGREGHGNVEFAEILR